MFRIITVNVNGIRAACRKEFLPWLQTQKAEVVCLQEIKANEEDLDSAIRYPHGVSAHFFSAQKKGYSGVGLYLSEALEATPEVTSGMGCDEFDLEGRVIMVHYANLTVVSAYLPSGTSSEERQAAKYRFLDKFEILLKTWMQDHLSTGREYVICGDWNIAHTQNDLKNWKGNQKNSGFLPEERAWMSKVLHELGWVDVYRQLFPMALDECYTWWSNRGQAWAKNVGWRIDYQIATPGIARLAKHAFVYKDQRFSDHAPLVVDYDFVLKK